MSELQEKVFSVVAEELNVEVDSVNMGSNFNVDLKADSLDVVELVMKLEETFGIEIPEDQAESIQTVGQAIEFIESKQNG